MARVVVLGARTAGHTAAAFLRKWLPKNDVVPVSDGAGPYATKPTGITLCWRTFIPWQAWRFPWINLKMLAIIRRGHSPH